MTIPPWLLRILHPARPSPKPTPPLVPVPGHPPIPASAADPMLGAVNAARSAHGLAPLAIHPALMASAAAWAATMAASSYLRHSGGPHAECVGDGYPDAPALVAAFLAEPIVEPPAYNHRSITLGDWTWFGGGMWQDRAGVPYWCFQFA